MDISLDIIKEACGTTAFTKGLTYYNQRRVQLFKLHKDEAEHIEFQAKVIGTQAYMQNIEITKVRNHAELEGFCSCPVGYNCKHVVAATLYYMQQDAQKRYEAMTQKPEIEKWLDKLDSKIKKQEPQRSGNEYFITYRFFPKDRYYTYDLNIYKSKILKNGSMGKGSKLDEFKFVHSYSYGNIKDNTDVTLEPLFEASMSSNYMIHLRGKVGYILVQDLIKTQRAFFDDVKVPLTWCDERLEVSYELKLYKGEYKLKSTLDENFFKLLNTTPPLALDIERNCFREVAIDYAEHQALLEMPKFEKDVLPKVFKQISTKLPTLNIKTPKAIAIKKITSTPVPHLHIEYEKNADEKHFTQMRVAFEYDEYALSYLPQKALHSFYEDDKKVEIQRDLAKEQSVKSVLEEYGFTMQLQGNDLVSSLESENRQKMLSIWKNFLESGVEEFEKIGWKITFDEAFEMKFEPNSEVVVESDEVNDWFKLSFNFEFDGQSVPIAPLVTNIINEFDNFENMPESVHIEVSENHFVEIQTKQIAPIIKTIIELLDKQDSEGNIKIAPHDAHLLSFNDDDIVFKGKREIMELSQKLKDFSGIEKVTPSKCLNAELRDYQHDGLNWLNFLHEFKFGGILADDMGLGKTIQTLAHLSRLKEEGALNVHSLVVMPTSLIANWKSEAKKFTPNLSVLSLHGSDRAGKFEQLEQNPQKYDILLTTYQLALRDKEKFEQMHFEYIILDEAQKIKNPKAQMTLAIKSFQASHRLALSGTPIENNLAELWSIYSFLMPGFLDTLSAFKTIFQNPIEKDHDMKRQELLNKKVKPFMLRRTKELVVKELPSKSEIIKYTQFSTKQSKLYESIRVTMEKKVREAVDKKGLGSSHITILDALLKLRQVCCDPSLLKVAEAQKLHESAKLELLMDLLDELLAEGRKILLFSQFTSMLSIIEAKIKAKKVKYTKLTGSTRKREDAIEKFTKGDASIFLISLKAGGVGLNLTEADTVIHYDPWWNPAVENQATDRAYRIGQKKAVFVYKLIVENSIEQKILELQEKKKHLQDNIYNEDGENSELKFDGSELLDLLK